jgi:hypothetical protein
MEKYNKRQNEEKTTEICSSRGVQEEKKENENKRLN